MSTIVADLSTIEQKLNMATSIALNPALSTLSSNISEKAASITVEEVGSAEEGNKRTFHDTEAAYVLPNE